MGHPDRYLDCWGSSYHVIYLSDRSGHTGPQRSLCGTLLPSRNSKVCFSIMNIGIPNMIVMIDSLLEHREVGPVFKFN